MRDVQIKYHSKITGRKVIPSQRTKGSVGTEKEFGGGPRWPVRHSREHRGVSTAGGVAPQQRQHLPREPGSGPAEPGSVSGDSFKLYFKDMKTKLGNTLLMDALAFTPETSLTFASLKANPSLSFSLSFLSVSPQHLHELSMWPSLDEHQPPQSLAAFPSKPTKSPYVNMSSLLALPVGVCW